MPAVTDPRQRYELMKLIRDGFPEGSPKWLEHNQKIIDFLVVQAGEYNERRELYKSMLDCGFRDQQEHDEFVQGLHQLHDLTVILNDSRIDLNQLELDE